MNKKLLLLAVLCLATQAKAQQIMIQYTGTSNETPELTDATGWEFLPETEAGPYYYRQFNIPVRDVSVSYANGDVEAVDVSSNTLIVNFNPLVWNSSGKIDLVFTTSQNCQETVTIFPTSTNLIYNVAFTSQGTCAGVDIYNPHPVARTDVPEDVESPWFGESDKKDKAKAIKSFLKDLGYTLAERTALCTGTCVVQGESCVPTAIKSMDPGDDFDLGLDSPWFSGKSRYTGKTKFAGGSAVIKIKASECSCVAL